MLNWVSASAVANRLRAAMAGGMLLRVPKCTLNNNFCEEGGYFLFRIKFVFLQVELCCVSFPILLQSRDASDFSGISTARTALTRVGHPLSQFPIQSSRTFNH